jgi:SWI/SNF-related matrix-associated actin-dependent regulator 1 of chromatin subfamily A
MANAANTMKVLLTAGILWVKGADFGQSQWLGDHGFWFYGRRSNERTQATMQDAGIPANSRYLPVDRAEALADLLDAEGLEWSAEARAAVSEAAGLIAASRTVDADVDVETPEGLSFRPYQRGGIKFILDAFGRGQRGVICGDEMGLGKTMQAIGTAIALDCERVLVVCPASLCLNWRNELAKWWPEVADSTHVVSAGQDIPADARIVVLNYEKVVGSKANAKRVRAALLATDWDLAIFDEAHLLKNEKAQRTRFFLGQFDRKGNVTKPGLAQQVERFVILTGTPIQNRVSESVTLLRAIGAFGPEGIAKSTGSFLFRYCGPEQVWTGRRRVYTFNGSSNLIELQAKLRKGWMVRRLKADVATELPPKVRTVVPFICTDEDLQIATPKTDCLTFAEQAEALSSETTDFDAVSSYRAALAEAKGPAAVEHVAGVLAENGKVIVFGHHRVMLDALSEAFGDHAIRIDGSVPAEERQGLVDRFQTDDDCTVAILSTHAAGVGLTLTAASTVVFAEADWNPSWCLQAEDRAHRIGQTADSVTIHYLTIEGTLDAHVLCTMTSKMAVADLALDRQEPSKAAAKTPAPVAPKAAPKTPKAARRTVTIKAGDYELTEDRIAAACEGLLYLAGRCDGARQEDEMGFNGRDAGSSFVKSLVSAAADGALSDKQAAWALKICTTYKNTQLSHLSGRLFPAEAK